MIIFNWRKNRQRRASRAKAVAVTLQLKTTQHNKQNTVAIQKTMSLPLDPI